LVCGHPTSLCGPSPAARRHLSMKATDRAKHREREGPAQCTPCPAQRGRQATPFTEKRTGQGSSGSPASGSPAEAEGGGCPSAPEPQGQWSHVLIMMNRILAPLEPRSSDDPSPKPLRTLRRVPQGPPHEIAAPPPDSHAC